VTGDPYSWPGPDCLCNKFGITDASRLHVLDARIVSVRDVELSVNSLPGEYNLENLMQFHRALFGDIYEWAGELRTVNIHKTGSMFAAYQFLDDEMTSLLRQLARDNWLRGLRRRAFIERPAYYGEINPRHPFREGNGRTQRTFIRQMSASAGWRLDWSELRRDDNNRACAVNLNTTRTDVLVDVLEPIVSHT
jgi:cell filamentation protein, protein adenylyltransferase